MYLSFGKFHIPVLIHEAITPLLPNRGYGHDMYHYEFTFRIQYLVKQSKTFTRMFEYVIFVCFEEFGTVKYMKGTLKSTRHSNPFFQEQCKKSHRPFAYILFSTYRV